MWTATLRNVSPSYRLKVPNLAPQSRVAFANIASKTASSSPGEREMTLKTSEVAVCCSSASVSSRVRACYLLEQAGVLDGDDGLVGESLQQLNLFACERSRALLVQGDEANLFAIAKERSSDDCTKTNNPRRLLIWKVCICEHVGNL